VVGSRNFYRLIFCVSCLILFGLQKTAAQIEDYLYRSDARIDSTLYRQLFIEVDNLSFFKNNEYNSTVQKGYTLPGFWLQLKTTYYPFVNLKLEAGAHSIWFWGATRYPAFAYIDISTWSGRDYSHNVHVLPFFRASLAFSKNVQVIIGNIYGGSNHGLIDPLYNSELNLSADPEAGVQLLYHSPWLDFDGWLDWISFIYRLDTHQESFITGFSSTFKVNPATSRFHIYFPLQGLAQHRGGELEITDAYNYTAYNGAVGVGMRWNLNRSVLKYMNIETDIVGYKDASTMAYTLWKGFGVYTKFAMRLQNFHLTAAHWSCKDFVPLLGNPFYGAVSNKINGMIYRRPKMLYLGIDYVYPLGKGYACGLHGSVYYFFSGKMYASETGLRANSSFGENQNFAMGVFMRLNPSFLLKRY